MTSTQSQKRILIVDDNRENLMVLSELLANNTHYEIIISRSGDNCLKKAHRLLPDLILLDVLMPPGINGFEVCKLLKADPVTQAIPVLFLTAQDTEANRVAGFKAGGIDYVTKPFLYEEVLARVQVQLQLAQARTDVENALQQTTEQRQALVQLNLQLEQEMKEKALLQKEMLDTSRKAGQADIAENILHNIGNVLTSGCVASHCLLNLVHDNASPQLSNLLQLLEEHRDDMPAFLSSDKGQLLPPYLNKLNIFLQEKFSEIEQHSIKNLETFQHIEAITNRYREIAGHSLLVRIHSLKELITFSIEMNKPDLNSYNIHLEVDYPDITIETDKHKVIQILSNIISNAIRACSVATHNSKKNIKIYCKQDDTNMIYIAITDNGCGISEEHMLSIFHHGFTTHESGSGFGLHDCAILAEQLNGKLSAKSDGPGHGATFQLNLPLK